MNKEKKIVIIGAGPAGLEAASGLVHAGHQVTILEKEERTGGNLNQWHHLFPDLKPAHEVRDHLTSGIKRSGFSVLSNSEASAINSDHDHHIVTLKNGKTLQANAVIIATGFQLFDATRKEEYGYKIYNNVITSADLEKMFTRGAVSTSSGKVPSRIAFVHCVGSRDKKSGNVYCSRVCCITGVKQAIEIKKLLPEAKVFNFYMDLRMYGQDFEELYIEAQQKWGVSFVRGRVSEVAENFDGSLQLKAEDTLVGRPLKMNFDLIVLLVGMVPSPGTESLGKTASLEFTSGNFLKSHDRHICANKTNIPGIFITGTCREPLSLQETFADARAASAQVISYLKEQ